MMGIILILVLALLYLAYINRENKFKEIERQQALRRAVLKLNEKNQRFSH